jgi:hypothetical protein
MEGLTLENCDNSASAGFVPRFSQILAVRAGHDDPEKTSVFLMVSVDGCPVKSRSLEVWCWRKRNERGYVVGLLQRKLQNEVGVSISLKRSQPITHDSDIPAALVMQAPESVFTV